MTTNQTIDGVPRAMAERIHACLEAHRYAESTKLAKELRAILDAPAVSAPLSIPDECPHMIVFDDTDREHMVFAGAGARDAALKTWDKISGSWNAHLFVRIERNSRDDRYPSAAVVPAAQPQGEPVALLSKGFTTLETRDGKYRIITQYKNRDDAWSDYTALCKAEQPAPVAVVLPTQEDFERFIIRRDGSVNVSVLGKSRFYNDPTIDREYFVWLTCLDEVTRLNPSL